MNRRSFLANILKGVVGVAILPTATTYTRSWKKPVGSMLWQGEIVLTDVAMFHKLPFYLAKMELKTLPYLDWDKLYAETYPSNMGVVTREVVPPIFQKKHFLLSE